jgi:DNA-binding ferritin-like protein (Dps family)
MIRDDVEFWDDDNLETFCSELMDKKTFTAKERKQLTSLVETA